MTHGQTVLHGRVRVNAIAPAAVATPVLREGFRGRPEDYARLGEMHSLGRIADPKGVAAAALFLCSPGASFLMALCSMWTAGNRRTCTIRYEIPQKASLAFNQLVTTRHDACEVFWISQRPPR
ncbi:MAG: SDR family oxidoreductase [Gammaproteobacteria bacterium]|nr:SDR family oxidoreductase [Gammaproteobacteria bacterium]